MGNGDHLILLSIRKGINRVHLLLYINLVFPLYSRTIKIIEGDARSVYVKKCWVLLRSISKVGTIVDLINSLNFPDFERYTLDRIL